MQDDTNINGTEFKTGTDLVLSLRISYMLKTSFQISRGRKNALKNWAGATDYISKEKNLISHCEPK